MEFFLRYYNFSNLRTFKFGCPRLPSDTLTNRTVSNSIEITRVSRLSNTKYTRDLGILSVRCGGVTQIMNTLSFNHPRVYFVSSHSTGHALIWDNGKCQQKIYSDVIWDGTTFLTRFWNKPQHDRNSRDRYACVFRSFY